MKINIKGTPKEISEVILLLAQALTGEKFDSTDFVNHLNKVIQTKEECKSI